ncbi:hypothetical protein [Streptomyces anulatus]|uniref:hypothetical protein n=1 Tax=Streptomyces anulatus TaxID=1892 RepID=UPI001C26BA99|nr:hypothetical protein [Streptomyces anulatus]
MAWSVTMHPDADRRLERLILPDEALADGLLITAPDTAATARRRRALFAALTERIGRLPYDARLGTVPARLARHSGPVYASVVQDDTEALHAWWHWCALGSSIELLDVAYTPHLPTTSHPGH